MRRWRGYGLSQLNFISSLTNFAKVKNDLIRASGHELTALPDWGVVPEGLRRWDRSRVAAWQRWQAAKVGALLEKTAESAQKVRLPARWTESLSNWATSAKTLPSVLQGKGVNTAMESVGKWGGRAGIGLGALVGGLEQWRKDEGENFSVPERLGRSGTRGALVGVGGWRVAPSRARLSVPSFRESAPQSAESSGVSWGRWRAPPLRMQSLDPAA